MLPKTYLWTLLSLPLLVVASPPHVIITVIDDLGWGNVGFHGAPTKTLPFHVNEKNDKLCQPGAGVPANMTMLPAKLKPAGYSTHFIGKWHMGMATPHLVPAGRGFDTGAEDYWDHSDGECNNFQMHDLWRDQSPATDIPDGVYGGYVWEQRAMDIVQKHDPSVPLFMYWALQDVHNPLQVPEQYKKMYSDWFPDRAAYNGMVSFADESVGNLTALLRTKGMWDNTLLIVTTDNGGPTYCLDGGPATNYPLRGSKVTNFEGGVRTIAFVTGGLVPADMRGNVTDEYVHICDWYATVCGLAGVDPTDNATGMPPIDSLDMWPLITGKEHSARKMIPLASDPPAMIVGEYKLITGDQLIGDWSGPYTPNGTAPTYPRAHHCALGCLFNIRDDPGEMNDLAKEHPALLHSMQALTEEVMKTKFVYDKGDVDPACCEEGIKRGYYWGPWLDLPKEDIREEGVPAATPPPYNPQHDKDLICMYLNSTPRLISE